MLRSLQPSQRPCLPVYAKSQSFPLQLHGCNGGQTWLDPFQLRGCAIIFPESFFTPYRALVMVEFFQDQPWKGTATSLRLRLTMICWSWKRKPILFLNY